MVDQVVPDFEVPNLDSNVFEGLIEEPSKHQLKRNAPHDQTAFCEGSQNVKKRKVVDPQPQQYCNPYGYNFAPEYIAVPPQPQYVGTYISQPIPQQLAPVILQQVSAPIPAAAPETAELPVVKPRWESPLRHGNWTERWNSAKDLSAGSIPLENAKGAAETIRTLIAQVIVKQVGLVLPTVQKWLHLLSEYLELNADELLLTTCLLKKYLQSGRPLVGQNDWSRPQRWECVLAISCYLAVLLSEEFPGRTANDLRELLGPQFRFGKEQVSFLEAVNWNIEVSFDEFKTVKDLVLSHNGSFVALNKWLYAPAPTKNSSQKVIKSNYIPRKQFTPDVPQVKAFPNKVGSYYNELDAPADLATDFQVQQSNSFSYNVPEAF